MMAQFRWVSSRMLLFMFMLMPSTGYVSGAPYYGKLIGSLSQLQHRVSGKVYAADDKRLYITEFNYDGGGPDAFAWMGNTASASSTGEIIPVNGSSGVLQGASNSILRLDLPGTRTLSDYKWISIWCRRFRANFGELAISSTFVAPSPHSLGSLGFSRRVHNVHAEEVIILNIRQLQIVKLDYDGNGPDAYYWAGTGGSPRSSGFALADESNGGSTGKLARRSFNDKTLIVTIPADRGDIFDIGHFGLWCDWANQDFGHVDIPAANSLNVPPYDLAVDDTTTPTEPTGTYAPPALTNCKVLIDDEYQVRWSVSDTMIEVALSARINRGTYMAFGLSGSDTRTAMVGSDVTVAWLGAEVGAAASAVDYYLSAYQQCVITSGSGACTDEISMPNGTNDVMVMDHSDVSGIITVSYTKALNTGDAIDKVIPTDREVYVSWAIGPINPSGLAAKHRQQPSADVMINFGQASSSCPSFSTGETKTLSKWVIPEMGKEGKTEFQLDIGQAGGQQGYEGITGSPGWGIAWYVDGYIIPVLTLKRNVTYTFTVNGGDDDSVQANYHPFYITNDEIGGYFQKTEQEKQANYHPFYITNDQIGGYFQKTEQEKQGVEIYAGPVNGSLCEWKSKTSGNYNPDDFDSFVRYRDSALERECESPKNPVTLTWTPDADTPDTVYYHCYTHQYLGWKINIVDEYTDGSLPTTRVSILALIISMVLAIIMM